MTALAFEGVELPAGGPTEMWIDESGSLSNRPINGAERLPGNYALSGLVDSHAHPSIDREFHGRTVAETATVLREWRMRGVLLVRDVGSPAGVTLDVEIEDLPTVQAAGRFLAPPGQYFPDLHSPVEEGDLISAALAEIDKGASWIKVIADFPILDVGTGPEPTYSITAIGSLVDVVHQAGVRVAAHSTIDNVDQLVKVGVDSIEHGLQMTEDALLLMAQRRVGWTPTLTSLDAADDEELAIDKRRRLGEIQARLRELLPLAVRSGVPVLAGTDVIGSIAGEVANLANYGLDPADALAAASTNARAFLGEPESRIGEPVDLVTYHHDPRDDPLVLECPAAMIARGKRLEPTRSDNCL